MHKIVTFNITFKIHVQRCPLNPSYTLRCTVQGIVVRENSPPHVRSVRKIKFLTSAHYGSASCVSPPRELSLFASRVYIFFLPADNIISNTVVRYGRANARREICTFKKKCLAISCIITTVQSSLLIVFAPECAILDEHNCTRIDNCPVRSYPLCQLPLSDRSVASSSSRDT